MLFGVQTGKSLSFTLTRRGIEANPDKCETIITMQSPPNLKEVHQLIGLLAYLSRFLSCIENKAFLFFVALKKKERLEWITKCEKDFTKLKYFLTSPLVLTPPKEGSPLLLYLSITDQVMCSVRVQDIDRIKMHM